MRPDRRTTVAGLALVAVAGLLSFDPFGVRAALDSWLGIADPATGRPRALARTITRRADRVETLEAALASDPTLSIALLATGLGIGVVVGSVAAYLHQRRRIRRGGHDGGGHDG